MKNQWKSAWSFGQICWLIFLWFLGGFWEPFWLPKSMKNAFKNWANVWSLFWWFFDRKYLPNGRPGGPQNRDISCIFRDPVPMTALGKQKEPKWAKLDPKCCQHGAKIMQKWYKKWRKMGIPSRSRTGAKTRPKWKKMQWILGIPANPRTSVWRIRGAL